MNKSGIEPLGNKVLVKPASVEEKTKGGIILADTIRDRSMMKQTRGELVAVGQDAWFDCSGQWAEPGDSVMFARYGGIVVKGVDGETYRLINDADLSAKIDKGVSFDAEY